jgi:hypothetical protein
MNAAPLLARVARALEAAGLDAVLIGNAAAALQGAPVTTVDLDFMFRHSAANLKKLVQVAEGLGGAVFKPFYPASQMMRLSLDDGMQLDFLSAVDGVASFASLRSRASEVRFGRAVLRVAALEDILKSKRAAGRPKDRAVMALIQKTLDEKQRQGR